MASLPTGARIAVATSLSAKKTISAVTNAAEAVCTSAAHGLQVGDIVIVFSGWGQLNGRVYRIKAVPTPDTFTLEGRNANTTNTNLFSPGGGAGGFVKALTWVDVVQILNNTSSGGDAKKVTYRYLESENEQEINDGFTPVSRSIEIDADAIETPGYDALVDLSATGADTIQRLTMKKGAVSYLACTVAFNEEVTMQDGQVNRCKADFSGKSKSTRYSNSV
ncbi:phage tail protein [Comamonas odontotermitis]|uniref:phage tail protein n=1 Tax=Comamonas odontotermitis TaxID=379895 RepID=UPI001CC65AA4|nr:phage tail protein [Comamonas odontotermitis]UBB16134.1 phage tail protein [Comamonas odontotermitis]